MKTTCEQLIPCSAHGNKILHIENPRHQLKKLARGFSAQTLMEVPRVM